MPIEDRMTSQGTLKRLGDTVTSNGAGGTTRNVVTVATIRFNRWRPSAYTRTSLRTELGLAANVDIENASIAYSSDFVLSDKDFIVEDGTGKIFRIAGPSARRGQSTIHHWSAVLVPLTREPNE